MKQAAMNTRRQAFRRRTSPLDTLEVAVLCKRTQNLSIWEGSLWGIM